MKRAKNVIYEYYLRTDCNFKDRTIGHYWFNIEKTVSGYPAFENKLEYHKPQDLNGIIMAFEI